MIEGLEIRTSVPTDAAAIERLYPSAFPEEDLLPVVRELLGEGADTLSLVAIVKHALVGHILFTACGVSEGQGKVSLLAPLAVEPDWQGQGIGSALIAKGLKLLRHAGVVQVFVLGDPNYYVRAGFRPEADVAPPYPLPEEWREAWQSIRLESEHSPRGKLTVPKPWLRPELWLP